MDDFRSPNQPKINQKSNNKSTQEPNNQNNKKYESDVFPVEFATSAMSCYDEQLTNMVPRSLPKILSNQHLNLHPFWTQLGSILGGLGGASWSQVGTQRLQKSIQKAIQKMITFWIAPRSMFGGFWLQLAPQEGGVKMFGLFCTRSLLEPSWGHLGPKIAQDISKRPLGTDPGGF